MRTESIIVLVQLRTAGEPIITSSRIIWVHLQPLWRFLQDKTDETGTDLQIQIEILPLLSKFTLLAQQKRCYNLHLHYQGYIVKKKLTQCQSSSRGISSGNYNQYCNRIYTLNKKRNKFNFTIFSVCFFYKIKWHVFCSNEIPGGLDNCPVHHLLEYEKLLEVNKYIHNRKQNFIDENNCSSEKRKTVPMKLLMLKQNIQNFWR